MKLRSLSLLLTALCLSQVSPLQADANRWIVQDIDGQAHDLSTSLEQGRKVAFVFWQTWCTSCKKEAPKVTAACEALKGKVDFVGIISGEDEYVDDKAVRGFIQKYNLNYPQVRDRSLAITEAFDVKGTPTIVVLGEGNRVLYRGHKLPDNLAQL